MVFEFYTIIDRFLNTSNYDIDSKHATNMFLEENVFGYNSNRFQSAKYSDKIFWFFESWLTLM